MIPASVGFQCPECVREGNASVRAPRRGSGLQAAGRRWGAVTLGLIAANVAMFVVTAVSAVSVGNSPLDNYLSPVFAELAQMPVLVQLGDWWRLISAAFLHIGPLHLAMNMLALLLFGSELERQLARRQDVRGLLTLLGINVFISFLPGVSLLGHLGGLVAGALAAGVLLATRRRESLQLPGLALLGVVLAVLCLSVPTIAVLGL
jgi:membrane associated rhomboid family serine protease